MRWILLLLVLTLPVYADSPLTATSFWEAYGDLPLVQRAHEQRQLDEKMTGFLLSTAPLDQKAALINALSWEGRGNAGIFRQALARKYKLPEEQAVKQLTPHQNFCLGYLTAQENYSATRFATPFVKAARRGLPRSFTVAVIEAVIESQDPMMMGHWEKVWPPLERVCQNRRLEMDMRPAGKEGILKYMRLYQEYAPR